MGSSDFTNPLVVAREIKGKESIVLYRNVGGIGDAVMITPAITALRKEFGFGIKIIVVAIPYIAPIFFNNPYIDYIVNGQQFESIDSCRNFFESLGSLFVGLSNPCPSAIYESDNEPTIYKSRQELFCEACGVDFDKNNSRIFISEQDNEVSLNAIPFDKYVVIHCSSNSRFRDLPNYHTDYLIRYISDQMYPHGVVLISHNWKYKHHRRKNIIRVIHPPLQHTIAVINNSLGLIGADSMGVHVAGALNKPSYGIFGMTDPKCRMLYPIADWYKGYTRCKRQYCWYHPCIFRFCLKSLDMKDVGRKFLDFVFDREVGHVKRN